MNREATSGRGFDASPLVPIAVGATLRESFALWAKEFPRLALALLVVLTPLELLISRFDPANDVTPNAGLYAALFAAVSIVVLPWSTGAVVRHLASGGGALRGYRRLDGALPGLVFGSLLAGLGTSLGILLLVVPGLILAARWSLLAPIAVLERAGPSEALSRSSEHVKGQTGRVLAVVASTLLVGFVIVAIPAGIVEVVAPGYVSSVVFALLFDVISVTLFAVVSFVVYRRLSDQPWLGSTAPVLQ